MFKWFRYHKRFVFLFVVLSCCGQRDPRSHHEQNIEFVRRDFAKSISGCEQGEERNCAGVKIHYLLAKQVSERDSVSIRINRYITDWLQAILSRSGEESQSTLSIELLAERYLEDYAEFKREFPESSQTWTIEIKVEILYQSESYVSLAMSTYEYSGGAHPNTTYTLANFEIATGQELTLSDMTGDLMRFSELAEEYLRKTRNIEPRMDLSELGFFLEDGRLPLPANVGITGAGLLCYYNPYEIAPYVVGPIEFLIPFERLEPTLLIRRP